jgi:hypothetical protein
MHTPQPSRGMRALDRSWCRFQLKIELECAAPALLIKTKLRPFASVGMINVRQGQPGTGSQDAEGKLADPNDVTIYRGVHSQHPALAEARAGKALPGHVNGIVTPEQHNDGGFSDESPYTSWTTRREVAEYYACRRSGGYGVILIKTVKRAELIPSPDRMGEGEVFLQGEVAGAQVEEIPGTGPVW